MEPLLFGIGLFGFVGVIYYALKTAGQFSTPIVTEFVEATEEA
jgi:hypothetical protein